ncbi:MAG: hypothetical protein QM813_08895 [Verrucomicrobiota bacterium]
MSSSHASAWVRDFLADFGLSQARRVPSCAKLVPSWRSREGAPPCITPTPIFAARHGTARPPRPSRVSGRGPCVTVLVDVGKAGR